MGHRPIRVAATLAGLSIYEGVAGGLHALTKQVDRLNKMKRRKDSEGATVRISLTEGLLQWLTEGLLIQRYRDVDAGIRGDVLSTLADCIISVHPELFLDNAYLRYLGWSLSDREEKLRNASLNYLIKLYSMNQAGALSAFTDRFKARILEMASKDVSQSVRQRACDLVEKMTQTGLLISEDCVELVKGLVEQGDPMLLHLRHSANLVLFGRNSGDMEPASVLLSIANFLSDEHANDMQQARTIAGVVTLKQPDQFLSLLSSDALEPRLRGLFLNICHVKGIQVPLGDILKFLNSLSTDQDRLAMFSYLGNHDCTEALLEGVMNELVHTRTEPAAVQAIKLLSKWRAADNHNMQLRVEQWIQTALKESWARIVERLDTLEATRKIDEDAPYVVISLLSTMRRLQLDTADLEWLKNRLEQIEGIALLPSRGKKKTDVPYAVYHRLLLVMYNDFLWTFNKKETSDDNVWVDKAMSLKQYASLQRPIVKQNGELQRASIAILTDVALVTKTVDDIQDILAGILQIENSSDEWKSIIVGRLYMADLIEDHVAIPLLISQRKATRTSLEICKAAMEKCKSNPISLIKILGVVFVDVDSLRFALSSYKPVLKGCGRGHENIFRQEIHNLHTKIIESSANDQAGSLVGFLLEEAGIEQGDFAVPPPTMKSYRRLFDKIIKKQQQTGKPSTNGNEDPAQTFNLTSHLTSQTDGTMIDEDNDDDFGSVSPSLPDSPLDKIIRLE